MSAGASAGTHWASTSRIVQVIRREAARAIHFSNLYQPALFMARWRISFPSRSGMDRVFFLQQRSESIRRRVESRAGLYGRTSDFPSSCAQNTAPCDVTPRSRSNVRRRQRHFHEKKNTPSPSLLCCRRRDFVRFTDVATLNSRFDHTVCRRSFSTMQAKAASIRTEAFWNVPGHSPATDALLIADEISCVWGRTGR